MKKELKQIEKEMLNTERQILSVLLIEVLKILNKSKYTEFVMAMGMWSFESENGSEYTSFQDKRKAMFKNIESIFDKYNDCFKLTGNAIWLKKDNSVCFHWTSKPIDSEFEKMTVKQIVIKLT